MNKLIIIFGLNLMIIGMSMAQKPAKNVSKEVFISELIGKMTLEEKLGQLTLYTSDMSVTGPVMRDTYKQDIAAGKCGNIFNAYTPEYTRKLQDLAMQSRLKIPLLFGYDVIHGHKTIFPIPLGESCSWDTLLLEESASIAAKEASADGLHWTFSPMVDISRDARWGRVSEGAGEDPTLGAAIARAKVSGYQGSSLRNKETVLSCVKHFALYGAPLSGRDYNTVDMSMSQMFNVYLPTYKAAIDAGAGSVMSSFNDINGVPATANRWLMNDLLRKQWGFKGLIVTDYTSINELVLHGVAANEYEAGVLALKAGIDMDMQGSVYYSYLTKALEKGEVKIEEINDAVTRILAAKWDLGLFENPYLYCDAKRAKTEIMTPAHLQKAEDIAKASVVLLKNKDNILPLKAASKIAFIGPHVKNQRDLIGNWSGAGDYTKALSLWDALVQTGNASNFSYAMGANLTEDTTLIKKMYIQEFIDKRSKEQLLIEALAVAKNAEIIVLALGESQGMSGEASSRTDIRIPENQRALMAEILKLGKPVVVMVSSGRPLDLSWEDANADAILANWFLGTRSGKALSDILFGNTNPSGKLTMSFPRNVGQVPIFYAAKTTGRPFDENIKYTSKYLDVAHTPLYPFGFGLSYTNYAYSNLTLSSNQLKAGDKLQVSVSIQNTGKMAGYEIVQLYVQDMVGSNTRPAKELKRFAKIYLNPSETKTVQFELHTDDLKYYNEQLEHLLEPGMFKVFVGRSSADAMEAGFELK